MSDIIYHINQGTSLFFYSRFKTVLYVVLFASFFNVIVLYWSMVGLQCSVFQVCSKVARSHTHTSIHFQIPFSYRLLKMIE